jgi:Family of unknown function (DUF6328)
LRPGSERIKDVTSEQAARRGETEAERRDRNLLLMMQELRVSFPGVQILFAFLLVVPFQSGWSDASEPEKVVYFVALLATAAASICFIAPTARHRIRFRDQDLDWVIRSSNRIMIIGLWFLGAALVVCILLITMVVFSTPAAIVVAAFATAAVGWTWFAMPLRRQVERDRDSHRESDRHGDSNDGLGS